MKTIGIEKIGRFVVSVWASKYNEKLIEIGDDEKPKEISPDELKRKIDETVEKMKVAYTKRLQKYKKEFGGRLIDTNELSEKEEKHFSKVIDELIEMKIVLEEREIAYLEVDGETSLKEFKNLLNEIEEYKLDENKVYYYPSFEYDVSVDNMDAEVWGVKYTVFCRTFELPPEKELRKQATIDVLYKNVYKAVRFDCEVVQDYLEGDLTFNGFIKKIDLFQERSC